MLAKNRVIINYIILYLVFMTSFLLLNNDSEFEMPNISFSKETKETEEVIIEKSYHPDFVRGLYLTAYSAGSDEYRQNIIANMKDSKINTVVIDIKDYSGYILYNSQIQELKDIEATKNRMPELKKIIDEFHQENIYVIARQTVFQDPVLARAKPELAFQTYNGNTWYDNKGLAWVSPVKQEVWEYNLAIAKEATELGFDEINFDYMRFPSDGNMAALNYKLPEGQTKSEVMKSFFIYLSNNLSEETTISIDTFGLVLDNVASGYDLNIGQKLTDMVNYFDYICPMMYPSHYPLQYLGYENSAEHPGHVISYGLSISSEAMKDKRAKLRPWIQAFHLRAFYYQDKIEAQEIAVEKATTTEGWLLWNARNYYPTYIF
ncbi:putative glycoside hydrolase [bacterium]|nr:putative glycoside hydrolase [bacterium]